MLDSTLVMVSSEFGRSPKINAGEGRDHIRRSSHLPAGGGIKQGQIYGSSDAICLEPADKPLDCRRSGNDDSQPHRHQRRKEADELRQPSDHIVRNGKVIEELLA
jgi:hypothetical protein